MKDLPNVPITLATNNGEVGGGEVMLLRIAAALTELGAQVSVVAPTQPSGMADAAEEQGLPVTRLKAKRRVGWMRALRRWDRTERTGVLWCNGLVPAAATAGRPDRIVHLHQRPRSLLQRLAVPFARFRALVTVVPSQFMQASFRKSVVMPNWTDAAPKAKRKRRKKDPVVVGFLGRPSTDKGVVTLAHAVRILDDRAAGRFQLLLAGEPRFVNPRDYDIVRLALARLGDDVREPGWMDRDEFFSQIDIFVMPSQWGEPFGLGAAEAMGAQVPVIVTDDGALPEVVGSEGHIVPARNARALADEIERVAHEAPATLAAHRRWRTKYSPDAGMTAVRWLLQTYVRAPKD